MPFVWVTGCGRGGWVGISCAWLVVRAEFARSGRGCGERGCDAAGGGAAGGESVATGRGEVPVGLGVTTGMGMTVTGREEGGREGDGGARWHSLRSSSSLGTWLTDSL